MKEGMKRSRINFNKAVVTADERPLIEEVMSQLSGLSPSDAFITLDFTKTDEGHNGEIQIVSFMRTFKESSSGPTLVPLMEALSKKVMVHIIEWKKHRFGPEAAGEQTRNG